jgi:hypothetical protein
VRAASVPTPVARRKPRRFIPGTLTAKTDAVRDVPGMARDPGARNTRRCRRLNSGRGGLSQDRICDRGLGGPRPRVADQPSRGVLDRSRASARWSLIGVVDGLDNRVPGPVNTSSLELGHRIACSAEVVRRRHGLDGGLRPRFGLRRGSEQDPERASSLRCGRGRSPLMGGSRWSGSDR